MAVPGRLALHLSGQRDGNTRQAMNSVDASVMHSPGLGLMADRDTVSEFHQRLRAAAEYRSPSIFWVVIIVGFFAIIIPCCVYSPGIANPVLLSTFAAVNGLVMYVILAIQNPFTPPVAFDSNALANLLEMVGRGAP